MKVVLTGATGFVGGEVLAQLLARTDVDRVTCLSRRPLALASEKLDVVILEDFARYDGALLARLASHDAAIWALGAKASDVERPDVYERITHGFTLALARGLAEHATRRFTFCYLSGMGADPGESAWLPWERQTRHLKGRTERDLAELASTHARFKVRSFRPGGILPKDASVAVQWLLAQIVIRVDVLARAMVRVAASPDDVGGVVSNGDAKKLAQ